MLRVIYINHINIMETSGQGTREREMVTRLLNDHEIEGYYIGQKPHLPSPIDSSNHTRLTAMPKKSFYYYARFQMKVLQHLLELTKGRSAEDTVIFLRYAPAMVWPAIISKLRNLPLVLRSGPTLYNLNFYKGNVSPFIKNLIRFFSGMHYRRALYILTSATRNNEIMCSMYKNLSMEKFHVLPAAGNPEVFHIIDNPVLPEDISYLQRRRIICFAGALLTDIGVQYIIRAMEKLTHEQDYEDVVLVIIGDGKAVEELCRETQERALNDNVYFSGPKSQSYINQVLNVAKVAVLPWGTVVWNEKGATPTKLFEYLATGINIVVTRHKDIKFFEDEKLGFLCNMDDAEDMADKLKKALDVPDTLAERQRRRNYMLQHHTWDIVYEKMKNEYWLPAIGNKY